MPGWMGIASMLSIYSRSGAILKPLWLFSQTPCIHLGIPRGGGWGQGGTLIFSHIRRLGPFFLVQNSEFRYFWGFLKNKYFLGYEDFIFVLIHI